MDINEQPLGYAQAKKRKKMMELEEQQKKVAEAQAAAAAAAASAATATETSATPEYAQGLTPINPPTTTVITPTVPQSYVTPSTPTGVTAAVTPQTRKTGKMFLKSYSRMRLLNVAFLQQQHPQHLLHLVLHFQLQLQQPLRLKVHRLESKQSGRLRLLRKFVFRRQLSLLVPLRTRGRDCL